MQIELYQIDAFTGQVFGGNPAAVCPLDALDRRRPHAEDRRQRTTSPRLPSSGAGAGDGIEIRWFTPKIEIDTGRAPHAGGGLCDFQLTQPWQEDVIRFSSKSGELVVTRRRDLISDEFPRHARRFR